MDEEFSVPDCLVLARFRSSLSVGDGEHRKSRSLTLCLSS